MGLLVNGEWRDQWHDTKSSGGKFLRADSHFRNWITADGAAGPSGSDGFMAEPGRYHLYVSYSCPWAHRTLIYRALKGLEDIVNASMVHWINGENGWTFEPDEDGIVGDKLYGSDLLYKLYLKADPVFSGRVTIPVLWDKKRETIVSNESSEIIRMLNTAFDTVGAKPGDFYPDHKRDEIDQLNDIIYDTVNNGVYKAGFATKQDAYEEAVFPLFQTFDMLEERLAHSRFLVGNAPSEADWRLFPTLSRFDPIYVGHFKCNLARLVDYPNLWAYTRDLYQWPGIAGTINLDHAKMHYYQSQKRVNSNGIVPVGPMLDWSEPHDRERVGT